MVSGFLHLAKRGNPDLVFYATYQLHRLFYDHPSKIHNLVHNKLTTSINVDHFGQD